MKRGLFAPFQHTLLPPPPLTTLLPPPPPICPMSETDIQSMHKICATLALHIPSLASSLTQTPPPPFLSHGSESESLPPLATLPTLPMRWHMMRMPPIWSGVDDEMIELMRAVNSRWIRKWELVALLMQHQIKHHLIEGGHHELQPCAGG